MSFDTAAVVVRDAVDRLGRDALDPQELFHEVSTRLQRVVPHVASGWLTVDPDTLLPSGTMESGKPGAMIRAIWRNERIGSDLNSIPSMIGSSVPVATLSQYSEAALERSERARGILRPVGLGDELRGGLFAGGTAWGVFALYRELGDGPFTRAERELMAEVAQGVADGLRRSLLRRPAIADPPVLIPGVVTFDDDGELRSTTAEAHRLIRRIGGDAASTLYAVAMDAARDPEGARSRVRLSDGRWLLVHGARLHGGERGGDADLAVTLLPAPAADVASMLLRLHGLSVRELQVAELLMRSTTTDEIATKLRISPHTLRDHTKSIFEKTGTSSRPQLMALGADPLAPSIS